MSRSEEDLSCPVCQDIFRDPVVLSCSHSFCRQCLRTWWSEKRVQECPVCKKISIQTEPPSNLALRNLSETFILERDQRSIAAQELVCGLHSEKLTLFCLDHQQPVCLVCRDAEKHVEHRFRPVDEAARQHKKKLENLLKPLKKKLEVFDEVRANLAQMAEHIGVQARLTEQQIQEQFQRLHRFLYEEEEARVRALREEEEQKSQRIRAQMEALSREVAPLSDTVRSTEDQLRAQDIPFLQNYKATLKSVQRCPLPDDTPPVSGALIDQAKHLGNLDFNIWSKMKDLVSYSPVVLDPNTVDRQLLLSHDLTSVSQGEARCLPENTERFKNHFSVLGSEGFGSGSHSWEVDVSKSTQWRLGVLAESTPLESGLWIIWFFNGVYGAQSPSDPVTVLPVKRVLQKVRVGLDCEKGRVWFSDPDANAHVHSFTHSLNVRLFPYFKTWDTLSIQPDQVSVTVEPKRTSTTVELHQLISRARKKLSGRWTRPHDQTGPDDGTGPHDRTGPHDGTGP